MLFAAIVVMALLMVLSSLGIEIGPLIAGAGVVGVPIGFGAQTLVKDVISGIFYLLDDAFRVGEYIQSGTLQGHRRELQPALGEAQAPSRLSVHGAVRRARRGAEHEPRLGDRQVQRSTSTTTPTSSKARKIIKKIGQQFAEDPEYAPHIIEPLKMQGVQNFGDFGIELRIKMMTKPGEQFVIRRKAYVAIKKAFEEDGIKIPYPTVMVREGESAAAAAAHLHVQR